MLSALSTYMVPSTGKGVSLQQKERRYQSAQTPEATGNRHADIAARNAALAPTTLVLTLPVPELPCLPPPPEYTLEDKQWIQDHQCSEPNQQGWYHNIEGRLILPEKLGLFLLSNLH
jgi:hypothetical protein